MFTGELSYTVNIIFSHSTFKMNWYFAFFIVIVCWQESFQNRIRHRNRISSRNHGIYMRDENESDHDSFHNTTDDSQRTSNQSNDSAASALHPDLLDVAPVAEISANATCGTTSYGSEEFCKLGSSQCSVCSSSGADVLKKHLIAYAIDNDNAKWWQSPTLEQGPQYEYVTVTLDLRQLFYVSNIKIKCANSPRPDTWILERSTDGVNYSPWQYFVGNEEDCWQKYSLPATSGTVGSYTVESDDQILCSTHYSKIKPMEGGEIYANIAKGRPGCSSGCTVLSTKQLREFSLARFLRFRFQKFNVPKDQQSSLSDPFVQKRLFYSIKKISIMAQCICHGHAGKCKRSHDMVPYCECSHNTCGINCDRCCPLYNQLPWKESTPEEPFICEQCQCHGHAIACRYDAIVEASNSSLNVRGEYRGGGVCINCIKHTTGINCEKCDVGWYRPTGVRPDDDEPCRPCDCHQIGSTGLCLADDSSFLKTGKKAGTCECLEGFDGVKCDRCAPGYYNFPNCEKCECDPRGTELSESCEKHCVCKANVVGDMCDKCKSGYFALSSDNPLGCKECFCSGISTICTEAKDFYLTSIRDNETWSIVDLNLNIKMVPGTDDEQRLMVVSDDDMDVDNYYWSAPNRLLGNKLTSYGLRFTLSVSWNVRRGDTSGRSVFSPDVILIGKNGLKIGHSYGYYEHNEMNLNFVMNEDEWYLITEDLESYSSYSFESENYHKKVTRREILSVLSDVKYLLVRAKFHTEQSDCSLTEASLEYGTKEKMGNESITLSLEQCVCPAGYTGLICESCDYGYVRLPSDDPFDHSVCSLCDCNGHSPSCDEITGQCHICEHNTTGSKCERCAEGFYGNAETGSPVDCHLCACPLLDPSNNFSPTCKLVNNSQHEYYCDKCLPGYGGNHCDVCADGYFGEPTKLGSKCERCDCAGRACNSTTGQCLSCEGNTEGWHCETCKDGYFGNAANKNCTACDCNSIGSENTDICDKITGQCSCKTNYVGRTCDRCLDGFGNIESGCIPCSCNIIGSESLICDPVSGNCPCKKGVIGVTCDSCAINSYGFPSGTGCKNCNCNSTGSLGSTCDPIVGQCACRDNVVGRTCDRCEDGYWDMSEDGCKPCECDVKGSMSQFCHSTSGQCTCKFGVMGQKCDQCKDHFYGFSNLGCFECDPCDKPGHICNKNNGRCVCPSLTEGLSCEKCISSAWNRTELGCQPCECNAHGSKSSHCQSTTGKCECRTGFAGDKCNMCAQGFYGFPKCRLCSCNRSGTDPETCTGDSCLCDSKGQCYCKVNAIGKKCDQCKEGTFGLHEDNIDGCTACFCFGRSTLCSEAGLTWSHIRLRPNRILTVHYDLNNTSNNLSSSDIYPVNTQQICFINLAVPGDQTDVIKTTLGNSENQIKLNVTNNLRLIPGETGDIEIGVNYLFDTPLYWQLPESFLGDRVLSYGGFIQFKTETEGGITLLPSSVIASYPLIQMQGNDRFILEYFPPLISSDSRHKVRLHESLWKLKNNPTGHVTRDVFMMTLQNLQHILIRATKSVDFTKATLTEVSMDIAVENFSPLPPLQSITYGVELCECPVQYRSSSCQNPEIGYYRYHNNKTTTVTSTIVIQLVGEAMPCECNGYSTVCEPESGVCLNCSNNTGGPRCENCAEGYYKSDKDGTCKVCPCPMESNNHAYTCYFPTTVNNTLEYATCYCKIGYTGRYCDRCNYGWYGYPRLPDGYCEPCKCNPQGSVSDECHEETGQCNCKPGITGRDCSVCEKPDQVLTNKGCQPCKDTCVQMLIEAVSNLTYQLTTDGESALKGKLNLPWNLLNSLSENYDDADNTYQSFLEFIKRLAHYNRRIDDELKKKVKNAISKIKRIWKHNQNLSATTKSLNDDVILFLNTMNNVQDEITNFINNLNKYVSSEQVDYNLGAYVNEARYLLSNIKDAKPHNLLERAENTLSFCKMAEDLFRTHENNGPGLKLLKKKVDKIIERVEDLDSIINNASLLIQNARRFSYDSRDKLQWIRGANDKINEITSDVIRTQQGTSAASANTRHFVAQTDRNIQQVNQVLKELKELVRSAEEKEGILFNLNPIYQENYVNPAVEHAQTLLNRAKQYVSLFAATKQDADIALKASTAYRRIVDALSEARQAINDTNRAIDELRSKQISTPIVEKAGSMEEKSRQLKTLAAIESSDVNLLQKALEYQQKYVLLVEKNLQDIVKNITSVSHQLIDINKTKEAIKRMNESLERNKNSMEIPDDVYDSMFYVQDNINDEIKPKLSRIKTYGEINIKPADELKIKETEEAAMEMSTKLTSMKNSIAKQSKYFEKWNSTVTNQLSALRSKIEQAKHLANGIRVSLSSKNDQELCTRSYQTKYLKPSITNSISITYAISSHHRDSLLFYLSSSISGDFLAVEMINRKIRFVWDVGGGPTELIHPLHIQTAGDLQRDQHWYRIEIRRIANIGKLSVRPVTSNSALNGSPVSNASVSGWSRLDVSSNDLIWIGGSNKPVSPYLLSKQNGLIGCLSQVIFDDNPIGLWNFKSESVGNCVACVEGTEETLEDDSYHFIGDGYSVLKGLGPSVYNKYVFTVSFNFKTYDENAILFYAMASKPEQFISITMKDGRVLVQIGYRENLKIEIKTANRYTTGNWTRVEMVRQYDRKKKSEKVALKVGSEIKEITPSSSPAQNDIPDLSTPQYFIGGLPPGLEPVLQLPGSFMGCISDVQVNQDAYNLLRGQYWGVQKSCSNKPPAVVGFQGNGYLELGSYSLKKSSSFYFVFSTTQLDAFLILSTTEGFPKSTNEGENEDGSETNDVNYYSVALREGRVELTVNVGNKDIKLISRADTNYSDGQFHAVNVIKTGKRLELRVDDIIQSIGFMNENDSSVVKSAGIVGGLFLGGVPSDITFNVSSVSNEFLFGTIKDVIFDERLIYFNRPIEFERALIGRTGPKVSVFDDDPAALTQSTQAAGANSCQKSYTYSVQPFAVQFGDLPKSYVRLDYDRSVFHQKNSSIELTFRTFYIDGALLIIPGADEEQNHYLKVFLFGGKIIVLVKGKRKLELQVETSYNDGKWHFLKLVRDGKNLYLHVDKSHSQKAALPKKLNFQNTVFIGGFSNEMRVFDRVFDKIEALKGCIKEVIINGKKEDLVGDRATHHHVGQCFPNVEKGVYFSGDSYAIAANNFSIGTSLQFELEFRTTEMNGVLMLISEPDGYPSISLELSRGRVILNGDMGDRRPFKLELEFSSIYHLCDNEWHQVKMNFVDEEISLHVDNLSKMYWLSDNGHITEAHTNSPLYIGGIPEQAAKKVHANKENFKGCMRNAIVRGYKLDWIEFPTTHNILLSSCPV